MARLHRLYEQKKTSADCNAVLGEYVRRWFRWTRAGITADVRIIKALKTPHDGGADNCYYKALLNSAFPSNYTERNKT